MTAPHADPGFLDLDLLAAHLKEKMRSEDLSLRTAASQIGCSAATLSRMLAGSKTGTIPESKNLLRAVTWLGRSLTDFEPKKRAGETTVADVEVNLRALPGLDNRDVEALVALVRAAHEKGLELRGKKP